MPFSRVHQNQSRSFDGAVRLTLLLIRIMNRDSVKLPAADTAAEPLWSLGRPFHRNPSAPALLPAVDDAQELARLTGTMALKVG